MIEDTNEKQDSQEAQVGVGSRTLGLERYVQFAFVVLAIVVFWFTDNLIATVWAYFDEPPERMVSGLAAVVGLVTAAVLYRNAKVKHVSDEVAVELSKVTWPDRKETRYATWVVIVASVIAAVVLGLMDTVWSAVTDFIYTGSVPIG